MGRYGVGGNLVYETTSGGSNKAAAGAKGNEYLTHFVVLGGLGPYQAWETLRFNDTILTLNGQTCSGGFIPEDEVQSYNPGYTQNKDGSYQNNIYNDHAWQNLQLGAPNAGYFAPPAKLASDNAALTEWTQAHGFSSLCAAALTIVYDQTVYAGGVPQYQWTLQGQKIYDPRLDSTYAGGSGPQRWAGSTANAAGISAVRGTWTFNQNPVIHALNFALGYYLPDGVTGFGRLYAGIGAGPTGVDIPAFVAAANVADAQGWIICGQWTTGDGKWSVLTEMLKAASATPVIKSGLISCIIDTPLTSLGTVTADDLSGPIKVPTGSTISARLNTVFPRFSSEAHRWQLVQADTPVKAATYVAEDGAVRSKTIDWQFVPAVNQACQLAAYTITNGREIAGIELPGKPKLRNYTVGDSFTLDIPEAGLATTKVMVTKRATDPMTGGVTLTVRTETDAKHAYSLGVSGVAPATPGISGYDPTIVEAPLPDFWATGALEISDPATGETRVVVRVTGSADDNVYAQTVVLRWRPVALVNADYVATGDQSWSYRSFPASQGQFDLDLNPGVYDVQIAYITINGAYPSADEDWLDLGIETIGGSTASNTANVNDRPANAVTAAIDAQVTLTSMLQSQIATANSQIASLMNGGGDSDSAAASASAAQAAQTAAENAQANALTYQGGALTAEAGAGAYAGQAQGFAQSASEQFTAAQYQAGLSANSAGSAQGFASAAGVSAAAAQQSTVIAASVGSTALNADATFLLYPQGSVGVPSGWIDGGGAAANLTWTGGFDSPNAIRAVLPAGTAVTILGAPDTSMNYAGPGYYVLELDAYLESGSWQGTVLFVNSYTAPAQGGSIVQYIAGIIDTSTLADIGNLSSATQTGRRQWSELIYVGGAVQSLELIHQISGGYNLTPAKAIQIHKAAIRPATAGEITGQQAFTSANANTATISSFQSAQTSQNSSFSTSIGSLNAAVFNGSGGSLQAQVTGVQQAQAGQNAAFATQIATVQAQVSSNPNLLPNGGFAQGLTNWSSPAGWRGRLLRRCSLRPHRNLHRDRHGRRPGALSAGERPLLRQLHLYAVW